MLIGYLGSIPFRVSASSILTFDDYSRSSSGRWTAHEIVGDKPLPEFLGPELEQISFNMHLRRDLGVNVERMLKKLRKFRDTGKPIPLIINSKLVNSSYWIVEHISEDVTYWGKGYILSCSVNITLREYV